MTAIIAWFTFDGKPGAASLYLASDSRITTKRADGGYDVRNDNFQKVFASPDSPDIFTFCGPTQGVQTLMNELMKTAVEIRRVKGYGPGAESVFSEDLFGCVLKQRAFGVQAGLSVFHGYRFETRRFGLTKVTIGDNLAPSFNSYDFAAEWGLFTVDGRGDEMVVKKQDEYLQSESESKGYSRWLWMSFHASLAQCTEVTCGGAPQLAALYGQKGGQTLGVYFKDAAFVEGKPCVRKDIEYRDELFQRVDASGSRLPNAQPHARMGRSRIFQFAP
jgi:hypothetical protein